MFVYSVKSNTTLFSTDFFDYAFTFSNRSTNVTCCLPDHSFKLATCGKGASCAGQCSALGASLCPSGNCTSDPKTCQFDFDKISSDDRQRGRSDVTGSSSSLRSCFPRCKVVEDESCCFHKKCFEKRPKLCNWANFTTGKIRSADVLSGWTFCQDRLRHFVRKTFCQD